MGKVYDTSAGFVRSCPNGYDSVSILSMTDWPEHRPGCPQVVHGANGVNNESIVYSDDAIRPVFLIFVWALHNKYD